MNSPRHNVCRRFIGFYATTSFPALLAMSLLLLSAGIAKRIRTNR